MDKEQRRTFNEKVLKKYNDAVIKETKDNLVAIIKKQDGSVVNLGCLLCFDAQAIYEQDAVFIQGVKMLPITAFVEDDRNNPLLDFLFVCPKCKKVMVKPDVAKVPLIGKVEEWKE